MKGRSYSKLVVFMELCKSVRGGSSSSLSKGREKNVVQNNRAAEVNWVRCFQ